jgi:hypothetical protein
MGNEREPIAKKCENGQIQYTCPICGGWNRGCEVYYLFLPFIDHLIRDLCVLQHPMLKHPRIVNEEIWYEIPGTINLLPGLSRYNPQSPDWKMLLGEKKKIHSQAEIFLPDISDWLKEALVSLEDLNSIQKSDILTAARLITLVESLDAGFQEQRDYLLNCKSHLEETGTDPKWLAKPGNQARFVADSMAGARWGLATSSSREMIRTVVPSERQKGFAGLKIPFRRLWWVPEELEESFGQTEALGI